MITEPLSLSLCCKLGSIARHAEEMTDYLVTVRPHSVGLIADGHAIRSLLADPEVEEFMGHLDALSLLPVKR